MWHTLLEEIAILFSNSVKESCMSSACLFCQIKVLCHESMVRNDGLATVVQGSALASDAFFPFSWNDSVEKACQAGVKAIAHPGGSVRDQDAIDCCNKYGVVLVTTNVRHFKH